MIDAAVVLFSVCKAIVFSVGIREKLSLATEYRTKELAIIIRLS